MTEATPSTLFFMRTTGPLVTDLTQYESSMKLLDAGCTGMILAEHDMLPGVPWNKSRGWCLVATPTCVGYVQALFVHKLRHPTALCAMSFSIQGYLQEFQRFYTKVVKLHGGTWSDKITRTTTHVLVPDQGGFQNLPSLPHHVKGLTHNKLMELL